MDSSNAKDTLIAEQIAIYVSAWTPACISRMELFRLVDWAQIYGIDQIPTAARLSLQSDERPVTSILLGHIVKVPVTLRKCYTS